MSGSAIRLTGAQIDNFEIDYAAITADVSVTGTTSASPTTCITGSNAYYPGGDYIVDCFSATLTIGTTNIDVEVHDEDGFLSTLTGHLSASLTSPRNWNCRVSLTPGNHTLKIVAFVDGGSGTFGAGDGATGDYPPASLRVTPA